MDIEEEARIAFQSWKELTFKQRKCDHNYDDGTHYHSYCLKCKLPEAYDWNTDSDLVNGFIEGYKIARGELNG